MAIDAQPHPLFSASDIVQRYLLNGPRYSPAIITRTEVYVRRVIGLGGLSYYAAPQFVSQFCLNLAPRSTFGPDPRTKSAFTLRDSLKPSL
jgi:hypothetical protein